MGWCLSRAHTWRLMFDPDYADCRFPECRKLGKHRNSHPVWRVIEVLAYFESHGLAVRCPNRGLLVLRYQMRVVIDHRQLLTGLGSKISQFVDCTVQFSEEEKAIIKKRGLGDHIIVLDPPTPPPT
jgi:hypothetical protein